MIERILDNINMDLIPVFKERVAKSFSTGEAIELEKTLSLCDQLPDMAEQRKAVVIMNYGRLKELNAKMSVQVQEVKKRKL